MFFFKFKKFNFEACNVCKILMRWSHNLLVDVKMMKNVGKPSCWIITIFFFYNLSKQSHELCKPSDHDCRNPTLAKCGGEAQHLEKVRSWSPPGLSNVQSSTARPKTPRIGVFLVSLERSWSVDIENGLALGICTFVAQVMGKRRAGSQIGSLTPDH